ncbi:hypothetical protein L0337_03095 [candidate division KSB1 bacterium]|nr:hypothetical protein [candidate division KSB1 bacterium]
MNKRLLASSLALLAGAGIFVACESMNGPQAVDESQAVEESFDISALESETGILRTAGVNADSANAFFVLRWSQGHGRFQDGDTIKGHASAVAYQEPTTLRDRNAAGLDMGTVSVLNGQNTYELAKIVSAAFGVRYGVFGGPRGNHGGRRGERGGLNGDPIAFVNIPFVAGSTYQFVVTGSENIAAMTLDIQAPSQLVQITGLADKDTIDATQDLTITWQGDAAANNVVLVLAPAFKRGRFGGAGQPVEPIFQRVDAAAGSYTIAAQTLQDLLSASNANAINLHLTQNVVREITDANLGKVLISAGNDDRVVLVVN